MKVYDCFTFYNEFELLELRLKSLWDMVDYFVLVEADKTHKNQPKPMYFAERANEFKEFLLKIRYVPIHVDISDKNIDWSKDSWIIENRQRDAIMHGLKDAAPDDLIFISDVDEFPALDILYRISNSTVPLIAKWSPTFPSAYKWGGGVEIPCQIFAHSASMLEVTPIVFEQQHHIFYLDYKSNVPWRGTTITKRKNLTTPQELRWTGHLTAKFPHIPNAGYHFSYMGGIERNLKKFSTFAHGNPYVDSDENLKAAERKKWLEYMREGYIDKPYMGDIGLNMVKYEFSNIKLPYITEFVKKYPYFLREHDFGKDDV